MNEVSLQNFEKMKKGRLARYAEIFKILYINKKPMSCRQIAEEMNVPHHKISGRVTELVNKFKSLYRVRQVLNEDGNPEWQVWFNWKKKKEISVVIAEAQC